MRRRRTGRRRLAWQTGDESCVQLSGRCGRASRRDEHSTRAPSALWIETRVGGATRRHLARGRAGKGGEGGERKAWSRQLHLTRRDHARPRADL
jgi:hypothetical protein